MEVIRETLWKRCLSTPNKPPAKNSNICLSETAYQHKGTRKKCQKTNQAAIIQWQRQCLMDKPHRKPWPKSKTSEKQATFLSKVPVHCITPFCSDALVSPPNLYPPCSRPLKCATSLNLVPRFFAGLAQVAHSSNKWGQTRQSSNFVFLNNIFVTPMVYSAEVTDKKAKVGMYIKCARQLFSNFWSLSNFKIKATTIFQPHLISWTE